MDPCLEFRNFSKTTVCIEIPVPELSGECSQEGITNEYGTGETGVICGGCWAGMAR